MSQISEVKNIASDPRDGPLQNTVASNMKTDESSKGFSLRIAAASFKHMRDTN